MISAKLDDYKVKTFINKYFIPGVKMLDGCTISNQLTIANYINEAMKLSKTQKS